MRERSHSPSAFACGSWRASTQHPRPSRPSTTKFSARRLGSTCRVTGSAAVSGSSRRNSSTVSTTASQPKAASSAGPDADVRRAALVAAAGAGDRAERSACVGPAGRDRQRRLGRRRLERRGRRGRRDVDARAVGEHRDVRHLAGVDVRGGEHAVRRRVARRRRHVEAGVATPARARSPRTRTPVRSPSGRSRARRSAAARTLPPARRRRGDRCGRASTSRPARRAASRTRAAFSSMSSPVSTNVISLRKPPSALSPTLSVGGGASPRTPLMRTRSGAVGRELDGVEAGGDVGARVARAADLVQQLRGDRADRDARRRCRGAS